ncbi:hypothetical protein BVI2075_620072 [Burkholderia vietnamiensis]|nr:hypothetical protein BVI2075_620072 [Burkholderia vietnamiensis]
MPRVLPRIWPQSARAGGVPRAAVVASRLPARAAAIAVPVALPRAAHRAECMPCFGRCALNASLAKPAPLSVSLSDCAMRHTARRA